MGKAKETVEAMNGIAETLSIIIVIAILLCTVTAWLIFQKVRHMQSTVMDVQNQETGKITK